jgi:hypothetical protein
MTSLELIRSKQRVNKATEDHAEAVKQKLDDEDTAKFAPLKKIYDDVRSIPFCNRRGIGFKEATHTLKAEWEDTTSSRHISFWDFMGERGWSLSIQGGKFEECKYRTKRTTEDVEVAKGWLIEKLATLLPDEKAN